MPITRSGYRSDADKRTLAAFYHSAAWQRARAVVLGRAGGVCDFCGDPPDRGMPLDVVHPGPHGGRVSTLELLRGGGNALDTDHLAAGHRRCHAGYSSGRLPRPR